MGKRKQPDFQKKKLRVGRQLPKGRNITDTSFKTKKIITPDQRLAEGDKSLSALLKLLDTKNASIKIDTLHKIDKYVAENKDTLSLFFPEILSKIGKLLMESDPKVTSTAVALMRSCVNGLSTLQYQSFADSMVLHLNCMMSHGSAKVKCESLNLLDAVFKAHPKVVSRSPKILVNLLDMISTWSKATMSRKLDEIISSNMTSTEWRVRVFHHMKIFLQAMMAPKENPEDGIKDKKEIHWDGKTRLYLPLYMGGLKPAKLDFSWYSQMRNLDDMRFKHFAYELVPVVFEAIVPVLTNSPQNKMVENDVVLSPLIVQFVNTILEVLCYIGEWVQPNLNAKESISFSDQELLKQLQNLVFLLIDSGFPYAQHDISGKIKKRKSAQFLCSQLNLNVCYLYTICVMEHNKELEDIVKKPVQEHMKSLFCATSGIDDNSIILIVKISKFMMKSENVDIAYKKLILIGMFDLMENFYHSQHSKLLVSFFMELSLDYDFQYLRSTEGMTNWFKVIFQKLDVMMQSCDIDTEFLNYVRQVCVRKYPEFIENLHNISHSDLYSLLQSNLEELQIVAIDLIMALETVPSTMLRDLATLICCGNIKSEKISIRLIRLLHTRFVRAEASLKEKLLFVKFLLNIGCDTGSLIEPEPATEIKEKQYLPLLMRAMSKTAYCILPTNKWVKHQGIFEACLDCLLQYTENELATQGMVRFMRSILMNRNYNMPVHVALAALLIRKKIGYLFVDQEISNHLYYLMFSCFMYLSIMTEQAPDDVVMYCGHELSKCLASFEQLDLCSVFAFSRDVLSRFSEAEYFYTMKIVLFLANRKKIMLNNNFMMHFLKEMTVISEQSQLLLPIWNKVRSTLSGPNT